MDVDTRDALLALADAWDERSRNTYIMARVNVVSELQGCSTELRKLASAPPGPCRCQTKVPGYKQVPRDHPRFGWL